MLGTTNFCYLFSLYVHSIPLGKEVKQEKFKGEKEKTKTKTMRKREEGKRRKK